MDLTRALQRMVRRYPGGSPALAAMLEMSPTTLAHKANPADARQWFSPEECLALTEATNDNDFINSFCAARGGVYLPNAGDMQALSSDELAAVMREASELVIVCTRARDENGPGGSAVTENEKAEALKEVCQLIAAAQEVYRRMCADHEATKPRHLRAA